MNLVMATLSFLTAVLGFFFTGERPEDVEDCSVNSNIYGATNNASV